MKNAFTVGAVLLSAETIKGEQDLLEDVWAHVVVNYTGLQCLADRIAEVSTTHNCTPSCTPAKLNSRLE